MKRIHRLPRPRYIFPTAFAIVLASLAGLAQGAAPEPTSEQRAACMSDFRRLCPGTHPGGGRVKACFEENLADLSPLCREAYEARRSDAGRK